MIKVIDQQVSGWRAEQERRERRARIWKAGCYLLCGLVLYLLGYLTANVVEALK